MSDGLPRDELPGEPVTLEPGEQVIATWTADRRTYWRDAEGLAVLGAAGVAAVLLVIGNAHVVIGAFGAAAAVMVRAAYLRSESLGLTWRMTDRRLIGPGGRTVALDAIGTVRKLFGDVQVITRSGDKHLLKHMANAKAVVEAIELTRVGRRMRAEEAGGQP
ncbi:MAG: hypothetical protein WCZ72_03170 [Gemmobacter sp.]